MPTLLLVEVRQSRAKMRNFPVNSRLSGKLAAETGSLQTRPPPFSFSLVPQWACPTTFSPGRPSTRRLLLPAGREFAVSLEPLGIEVDRMCAQQDGPGDVGCVFQVAYLMEVAGVGAPVPVVRCHVHIGRWFRMTCSTELYSTRICSPAAPMPGRSSQTGGTTTTITAPTRASTGSHRTSLQPGPERTTT
jgi:hypothetical protein